MNKTIDKVKALKVQIDEKNFEIISVILNEIKSIFLKDEELLTLQSEMEDEQVYNLIYFETTDVGGSWYELEDSYNTNPCLEDGFIEKGTAEELESFISEIDFFVFMQKETEIQGYLYKDKIEFTYKGKTF